MMDMVVSPALPAIAGLTDLRSIDQRLATLTRQADVEFMPVGKLLSEAVTHLHDMTGMLRDLGLSLNGDEARHAVSALTQAVAGIHSLGQTNSSGSRDLLPRLAKDAEEVAKYLDSLRRIISEITALAINGKIQAALVATAGVDFTVFTSEIGRLGSLAAEQIEQACNRLAVVRNAITAAVEAESAFARNEATELNNIRTRIESNIGQLVDRGRRAAQAIDRVGDKSRLVGEKVGHTVGELQINDITCQRIEHVRTALQALVGAFDSAAPHPAGTDWLRALPPERLRRSAAATGHLQQKQLDRAATDYQTEIDALIRNLRSLSSDAADVLAEADTAFGDNQGGLFLVEIERDASRAITLMETYTAARERTRAMVSAVSAGIGDMTRDLEAIRSIDADMRVMGLNATLKCGRLGPAGLALGVVAQELRAASRRTEDTSRIVGKLLEQALATAQQLSEDGKDQDSTNDQELVPSQIMSESLADLTRLSATMTGILGSLREAAPLVAHQLEQGADSITFHRKLREEADSSTAALAGWLRQFGAVEPFGTDQFDDVRRLVEHLYTMDQERVVHQQFDGRVTPLQTAGGTDAVDELFF